MGEQLCDHGEEDSSQLQQVSNWLSTAVKNTPRTGNSEFALNPRDLNEALEREPYYTRSIEEIMAKFHGMTRFTIADFNKGYWMVELDPESRKYTTMALDIGRFQWTRLPMGSVVAQDVFQRKLDGIFLDVPGVTGIADDMVIYGRTDLEHDRHLVNFLDICRKNILTLNPDKMQFRLPQVSFFGHQWSAKGPQSRSKEDCSSQKNGFTQRCWHNEKFPRTCELSQQV